jgi:DNA-binding NarL/FixJ family response regulator
MAQRKSRAANSQESDPPALARVLIVDDHQLLRDGIRLMIDNECDLEVCGEAEGETEAVHKFRQLQPDLVVVDISLKTGNGIELIKRIKTHQPAARIIVSTMHDERIYGERALRAGAMGFVNKQDPGGTLLVAIRHVLRGNLYFGEQLTQRLLQRAIDPNAPGKSSPVELLADRELEAFELIGRGLSSQEIASRMHISHKTVDRYRENIKRKLDIATSNELIRQATLWVEQKR